MSKQGTSFLPSLHGFHFGNQFLNKVIDIEMPLIVPGLEVKILSWTTWGRCGGMSYAALDYFNAGFSVPTHRPNDFPNGTVPEEDGSPLGDYIYDRLSDSIGDNWWTFYVWTSLKADHNTDVWGDGLHKLTIDEQLPALIGKLKEGPVPIGLVCATSVFDIGKNHTVLAYYAEKDETPGVYSVRIYDPNRPNDDNVRLDWDGGQNCFVLTGGDANQEVYRGYFVMDFNTRTPTYFDLVLSEDLTIEPVKPDLGGAVTCGFTVQNAGCYDAHINNFTVQVSGPGNTGFNFGYDALSVAMALKPGESQTFSGSIPKFGALPGSYHLKPAYFQYNYLGIATSITPPTLTGLPFLKTFKFFDMTVKQWVPSEGMTLEFIVTVNRELLAPPPFLGSIDILYGLASGSVGNSSQYRPCEQPATLYSAYWDGNNLTRELKVLVSKPLVLCPSKMLLIRLGFETPGRMAAETVSVKLIQMDPNHGPEDTKEATIIVIGNSLWATLKCDPGWVDGHSLRLAIDGRDDLDRPDWRIPKGDQIDNNPATAAYVDQSALGYPFVNYNPGVDYNHGLQISAIRPSLPPDPLEPNDAYSTASAIEIARGAPGIILYPPAPGFWIEKSGLNFDRAEDQDVFYVHYEDPNDGLCQIDAPVMIGMCDALQIIHYPPSTSLSVAPGGPFCTDLAIFKSDRTPFDNQPKSTSYTLYNPTRSFPDRKYYVWISNTSFVYQGTFGYGATFGYVPEHLMIRVDSGSELFKRFDIRRRFLNKLYAALDLPRPPEEILLKTGDPAFPFDPQARIIGRFGVFSKKLVSFLGNPDVRIDLQAAGIGSLDRKILSTQKALDKLGKSMKAR